MLGLSPPNDPREPRAERRLPLPWLDPLLIGLFLASWVVVCLHLAGWLPLYGLRPLGLYPLYSLAAALGWVVGNVYVVRSRQLAGDRRRLIWARYYYFFGPPGIIFLLRAMASLEAQEAAPLVPLFAFGVFAVFFSVPVVLKPPRRLR